MEKTFYSNGKLLLTGEYLVLDGARALAIPTKKGQFLKVLPSNDSFIYWNSFDVNDQIWLFVKLDLKFKVIETSAPDQTGFLVALLKAAKAFNPSFLESGYKVSTYLEFPNDWGLGSSSTLISNVAQWAEVDPFKLHFEVTNGSGYDIACATANQPLLYTLNDSPEVEVLDWNPPFADQIYFIHLNQKQRSNQEVERYSKLKTSIDLKNVVNEISELTVRMIKAKDLNAFEEVCKEHEYILSSVLQVEPIKEQLFQMYQGGVVKSLGAWGGDFVMVTAQDNEELDYFRNKGYHTIFSFQDFLLLNKNTKASS